MLENEPVPGALPDVPKVVASIVIECAQDGNTRVRGDYTRFPLNSLVTALEILKAQVVQHCLMQNALAQAQEKRIVPANGPIPNLHRG